MQTSDFISNGLFVQFPLRNLSYKEYEGMSAVVVRFPIVEGTPLYVQLPYNSHHYTTFYHIQYVMPILGDLLGFKFLKEEFNLKNNIVYL